MVVAIILTMLFYKKTDLTMALNGALGGLVAITAEPLAPSPMLAIFIGAVGGLIVVLSIPMFDKFKVDDVIDLTVVSSATSSVTAVYDPGTRFVSIGSSVNPPISLTLGDTLQIDTSDVSLENTKLSFFLDQNYRLLGKSY